MSKKAAVLNELTTGAIPKRKTNLPARFTLGGLASLLGVTKDVIYNWRTYYGYPVYISKNGAHYEIAEKEIERGQAAVELRTRGYLLKDLFAMDVDELLKLRSHFYKHKADINDKAVQNELMLDQVALTKLLQKILDNLDSKPEKFKEEITAISKSMMKRMAIRGRIR